MTVLLRRLQKPWFVYRPTQIVRRLAAAFEDRAGYEPLRTSWGAAIVADPTRTIGRAIAATGVYEIGVSEVIARLLDAGDTCIDAGANVGYMTVLAATAVGSAGVVRSFEPHPDLFRILQRNARGLAAGPSPATCVLNEMALGGVDGTASLVVPDEFAENDGTSFVSNVAGNQPGQAIDIKVARLDGVVGTDARVRLLKMDVEGFESQVLKGASELLERGQITNILYEDHRPELSGLSSLLADYGFAVMAVRWRMRGPIVLPLSEAPPPSQFEPQNFLATLDPDDVRRRCAPRGWRVLKDGLGLAALPR